MRSRGWLKENRVWAGTGAFDTTITLRPLHRPDLAGFLAVELGPFLAELRVPEDWDGAIHARTATLRVAHRPAIPFPHREIVGTLMGGIEVGAGGIIILPNGHIKRVPPRGPVTDLVGMVADLVEHDLSGDVALGLAQRRGTLRSIIALCDQLYEENDTVSTSPVRFKGAPGQRSRGSKGPGASSENR